MQEITALVTREPRTQTGESFQSLLLGLRGKAGLTQRNLAARLNVHPRSVQGWESGANYPSASSLRAVIAAYLAADALREGRETEEASAVWTAALQQAPRMHSPFDPAWFAGLLAERKTRRRALARQDWGEAPSIAGFRGRSRELTELTRWVSTERCRVVALLGLGGIGKTALAARLADQLAPEFDRIYWRNLRDGLPPNEWLAGAIAFFSDQDGGPPKDRRFTALLELLREKRCLLVLDNVETILQPGESVPAYREGYEQYGSILQQLAESSHRSCLLLTGREAPHELQALLGEHGAVRSFEVGGLDKSAARALLDDKVLSGSDSAWAELVNVYDGNGLALRIAGETIRRLFGADIASFLRHGEPFFGGISRLLDEQLGRLSEVEHSIVRWLAIQREPVELETLGAALGPGVAGSATVEALAALRGRSLIAERRLQPSAFTLQSVVLAYVTDGFAEEFSREIVMRKPTALLRYPLLIASAAEGIRRSQERQIAFPVLNRLVAAFAGAAAAARSIVEILDLLRARPPADQGFGPGNLINLLRLLQGNLRGANLSALSIREAYLIGADAADASLAGADVTGSLLAEAFDFPVSLAISPDGKFLASGTWSGEVRMWRLSDRTLVMSLSGHAGPVLSTAFSGDGRVLAACSADGDVRVWDARDGQQVTFLRDHAGAVRVVSLNGDGRLLASAGADGQVNVWHTSSGRRQTSIAAHNGVIYGASLSEDGRLLASGGIDGAVRIWDATSGQLVTELQGQVGPVSALAMSSDGRLVATGGNDGAVRLWDSTTGQQVRAFRGRPRSVVPVALSHDGELVASADSGGSLRIWNARGQQLLAIPHDHNGIVRAITLDAKGELLASAGADGSARLWQTATGHQVAIFQAHSQAIHCVASADTGRVLASGAADGSIALWTPDGEGLAMLRGHDGAVYGVALSDDGRLLASGGLDGTARLWDATKGQVLRTFEPHAGPVYGVALARDGRFLVTSTAGGVINVWTLGRRRATTPHGHATPVWSVAMSDDGRLLASGGLDGVVQLSNPETGQMLTSSSLANGGVWGVALDGGGRLVAAGGQDGSVTVREVATGQILTSARAHIGIVYCVALSRDGRVLASAGQDSKINVWQLSGAQSRSTLLGHTGAIWGLAFSGDGRQLISGGMDGTMKVWEPTGGALLRTIRGDRLYERLDITGLIGVTQAQRASLIALGAQDRTASRQT